MGKRIFTFMLFGWLSFAVFAQQTDSVISDNYLRNSLTTMFIDFPKTHNWDRIRPKVQDVVFSEKYDNHNLSSTLHNPYIKEYYPTGYTIADELRESIEYSNVAHDMVAKWFNRQENGLMDMQLVHERGRYTAVDQDVLNAEVLKRRSAVLEDMGNELLNRNYLLLIGLNAIKTMAEKQSKNYYGWQASVTGYLFRLDFNDNIQNKLYESWIYEEDTLEVINAKIEAFNKIEFPIEFIETITLTVTSKESKKAKDKKSMNQLTIELVQKAYDLTLYELEKNVPTLNVVTSLHDIKPLRAKIGFKEGLKTDQRFFVYEHIYNPDNDSTRTVRRGVIRAKQTKHIHDNRHDADGEMGTSEFYQVAGRRLHPGYTILQQNELDGEITIGRETGSINNIFVRAEFRMTELWDTEAFFAFFELAFDRASGNTRPINPGGGFEEFTIFRLGILGLAKGFHFFRNFELRPHASWGIEGATNKTYSLNDSQALQAFYVKLGSNLSVNITHNFQLICGVSNYFINNDVSNFDEDSDLPEGIKWENIFEGRNGISYMFGVKVTF
jgi:hypothetical protein